MTTCMRPGALEVVATEFFILNPPSLGPNPHYITAHLYLVIDVRSEMLEGGKSTFLRSGKGLVNALFSKFEI